MMSNLKGFTFDDVILVPAYNGIKSRQNVTTSMTVHGKEFTAPLMSANMDTITEVAMADAMAEAGGMGILHRFMSIEENVAMFKKVRFPRSTGISIGIGEQGIMRAEALVQAGAEIVCVDVAHGHSKQVNQTIRTLRATFGDNVMVIAGNVATYAGADYLAAAGADVIKVGIGSGSVCSTRIKTGFGVPQLTAIMECSKVDRAVIADGGIRHPSDVVKSLAAGASMVMLGGLLAGSDETPGEVLHKTNEQGLTQTFKRFRGMASKEAQEDFMGSMSDWKTAEGVATEVPARGPVKAILADIMGGLRSGMTYCGAATLADLRRKAQFMEITAAARYEGTPHALDTYTRHFKN